VYAAEKIIEELAKTPNKDDLSNTPYNDNVRIKILLLSTTRECSTTC
jgi:hypothetical protein